MRYLSRNALLAVVGATLVSACATVEDVQRAQATADEALARSDRAGGLAQSAMTEAQNASRLATDARAASDAAMRRADEANFAAQQTAQELEASQRPPQRLVARGERG